MAYFSPMLFVLFFLINSCGLVDKGLEIDSDINESFKRKEFTVKGTFCEEKDSPYRLQFFSNSKVSNEIFSQFYSKNDFKNFNDHDFFVSFILTHLIVRPDLVTPSSRLQFLHLNTQDEVRYSDFDNDDSKKNLFLALEKILQENSRRTLSSIAHIIDNNLPPTIAVEEGLQNFLHKKRSIIKDDEQLSDIYLKGNQTLRVGETFRPPHLSNILKLFQDIETKETKNISSSQLMGSFQATQNERESLHCNFDYELYQKGAHLVSNWKGQQNLDLGIYNHRNKTIYLATVASRDVELTSLSSNSFKIPFSTRPTSQSAFCYLKHEQNSSKTLMSSTRGRDPGQFIYQMLSNKLNSKKSKNDKVDIINQARTLNLYHPKRILYEKTRGSSEKLQELYTKNIPIYYAQSLGSVTIVRPSETNNNGFILDSRVQNFLQCL